MNVQFGDEQLSAAHASALEGWVDSHPDLLNSEEKLRTNRSLAHLHRRLRGGGAPVRPFVTIAAVVLTALGAVASLWYTVSILTGADAALNSAGAEKVSASEVAAGIFPVLVLPIVALLLCIAILAASTPTWARVICIVLGILCLLTVSMFVLVFGSAGAFDAAQPMLALAASALVFVLAWILGGRK